MTRHTAFLELASMSIDAPLASGDRERLAAHLADCTPCARTAAALRADAQAFMELPHVVLPERRGAAILAAARTPSGVANPMRLVAVVALLGLLLIGVLAAGAQLMHRIDNFAVVPPAPSVPAPSAVAVVTAAPSAHQAWVQVGSFPVGGVLVRETVGFAGGYASITSSGTSVSISADGVSWRTAALPFTVKTSANGDTMGIHVNAIASDGKQLIVAGGYFHEPCRTGSTSETGAGYDCPTAPIAWTSRDGTTWQSAYPGPMPTAPADHTQGSEFVEVWSVPTGGWDAAVGYWEGGHLGGTDLMHSPDGIAWTALASAPGAPSSATNGPTPLEGIAAGDGTRLIWENWQAFTDGNPAGFSATVASSPDGASWTPAGDFPGQGATVSVGIAPAAGNGTWLLVGSAGATADVGGHAAVWRGAIDGVWAETRLPEPEGAETSMVGRVLKTTWGFVALGAFTTTNGSGEAVNRGLTWTSPDGTTWSLTQTGADPMLNDAGTLADGPAGIVSLVGYPTDQDSVTRVFVLR